MSAFAIQNRGIVMRGVRQPLKSLVIMSVLLGLIAAALIAVQGMADKASASNATVQSPPAKAAALVAATSASGSQFRAVGEEAKLINASLPFSSTAIQASRPFAVSADSLDHRRALLCLTQAVYYEAGVEPVEGRRAVAQVVLNRMRHPAFPKSVCGVVYQGAGSGVCQFTFVCDGSLYRRPILSAWREAEDIAAAALAGYVDSSVGAATHYHADYVAPRWAPMLTKITKIGAHIFYRWPGTWGQQAAFSGRYVGEPNDPLALRPPPPSPAAAVSGEAAQAAEAGPPVARAPNDVGGLLDPSKGWTLSIPAPEDVSGAAARALAEQGARNAPSTTTGSHPAPVIASR